jgi:hypothetical protein
MMSKKPFIKNDDINMNREIAEYYGGFNLNNFNYFEYHKYLELDFAAELV